MINEIINILHERHNEFCVVENKLEEDGVPVEKIHNILYYRLMKLYGGIRCFKEDMDNIVSEAYHQKLDINMLFGIGFLLTKKRRMALIKRYNEYKNIYLYNDIKAFICAISKVENNIKKTCNLK